MNEEYNGFEQNEEQSNTFLNEEHVTFEAEAEEIPVFEQQDSQVCFQEAFTSKPQNKNKRINPLMVALSSALMLCLIIGTVVAFNNKDFSNSLKNGGVNYHSSNVTAANVANTSEGQFVPTGTELTTAEIAAKVGPSVVGIESKITSINIFQQQTSNTATGSGVIVNEDGYIVTNYHVVEGAKELKVILNSGKEYPATLVGYDERSDLAVVKIEEKDLAYATFGDSSQLMVGERAIAIGNPLGTELMGTVTQGIISAVNRTVQVEDKTLTLLQTDAAINSGNSGGALINAYGEVIGINTVKMYATGVEGIGFAIPSNEVKTVLDDIISYGYVRGRLVVGVTGTNITEKMSKYYELPIGFYVSEVREGYGAYLAGVEVGDVIIKCDGKVIETIDDINKIRDSHKVNDYMEIVVSRNGKNVTLKVRLMEEKPDR
ncbi:MAG: trypsin-like peptidase domain-containing protein [Clostridia bacterium]|nr:trypsin-like peptidase domain-containing protein [Clostridia bacterium]